MEGIAADELIEPTPDIHHLFCYYNALYFESSLGGVIVEWSSSRMTSCGGTCAPLVGGAVIRLSKPLLSLRPVADLKDVLLHEMIHAYMMVHRIRDNDPGGHGDVFKQWMKVINASRKPDMHRPMRGYRITVYHTMFREVDYYRQHHWTCGRCGDKVKRSMNRKPQVADCRWKKREDCSDPKCRWHMHEKHCGGEYVKTREPEGKKRGIKERTKKKNRGGEDGQQMSICRYMSSGNELEQGDRVELDELSLGEYEIDELKLGEQGISRLSGIGSARLSGTAGYGNIKESETIVVDLTMTNEKEVVDLTSLDL